MRVCVFVDGENLRFATRHLFPAFDRRDYLPKNTDWSMVLGWDTLRELLNIKNWQHVCSNN